MTNQIDTSNSENSNVISEDGSLNETAFLAALGQSRPTTTEETPIAQSIEKVEPTEPTEDIEKVEEVEKVDETEEQKEETESSEDVLSQIDWENADWENFDVSEIPKEVAVKINKLFGGAVHDVIGKLRQEKAQEKAAREAAEAQLRDGLDSIVSTPQEFKDISNVTDLEKKAKEWRAYRDSANKYLDSLDMTFELEGVGEVDRSKMSEWRDYYQGLIEKVPEQKQRIRDISGYSAKDVMDSVTKDVPELLNEESETYKSWRKIVDDPQMALIKQIAPKQYALMQKMAAHSVAFTSKKKVNTIPFKKPKTLATKSNGAQRQQKVQANKGIQEAKSRIATGDYTEKDIAISLFGNGGAFAPKQLK